jgi:hypothetical protein
MACPNWTSSRPAVRNSRGRPTGGALLRVLPAVRSGYSRNYWARTCWCTSLETSATDIGRSTDAVAPTACEAVTGRQTEPGKRRAHFALRRKDHRGSDHEAADHLSQDGSRHRWRALALRDAHGAGHFHPQHMHPMQHERVDVVSGIVRLLIRGRERSLASGQTLVVDPREAHEVHTRVTKMRCL